LANLRVMMTTEGTYPFHMGGVSTWCDALTKGIPNVEFVLYSILMNPFVTQKYQTSPNVKQLIKVPLWGTEEPSEHLAHIPFSSVYLAKRRTTPSVIRADFLPMFEVLARELASGEGPDLDAVANTLVEMYRYFAEYDYQITFKSPEVWGTFKRIMLQVGEKLGAADLVPSLRDLTESLGWLYRFFVILNTPLPKVHVTHSAAAAFCGIPCIIQKIENKTPYLLSEHGIYLREQYINTARMKVSKYSRRFLLNLVSMIAKLSYEFADQVSPVCQFNTRWERRLGVADDRIKVIYNGVDPRVYTGATERPQAKRGPSVVCVARIDPIKDIETLIRAAALVKQAVPRVQFVVYGAPSSPAYFERCLTLRNELGLEETFIFAGHTDNVVDAYKSADVVALSSISEGFPYSVIEAMMSGKAIVATDVGGVREAVEGCGFVVPPRSPDKLAAALVKVLRDDQLRAALSREARNRSVESFSIARLLDEYLRSYIGLHEGALRRSLSASRSRQALFSERGLAFMDAGMWQDAVEQFRKAIDASPASAAVPVLLTEVAQAYNNMGRTDLALLELQKAEIHAEMILGSITAA